jgi:DNA-binding Xre family transcriptional regulator
VYILAISYNKLWHILVDKSMTKEDLRKASGISTTTLNKLKKGQNITTDVLQKICRALFCDISDIMEITAVSKEDVIYCQL